MVGATFIKFRGEMTHFRQGLRSGRWPTAARARGYGLILPAICAISLFARHGLRRGFRPFRDQPAERGLARIESRRLDQGLFRRAGKIFHAVAVRQRFSTFSMSRVLRRIGIGIIV